MSNPLYASILQRATEGDLAGVQESIANCVKINSKNKYGNTALMYASTKGSIEMVKYLIENGSNVNFIHFQTALHLASTDGYFEIVKLLVENRANISIQDYYEKKSSAIAEETGHEDIVEYLEGDFYEDCYKFILK